MVFRLLNRETNFATVFLFLCLLSHTVNAQQLRVVVGDPTNPAALPAALQAAYANGARTIIINPGTYIFPPTNGPVFDLKSWSGATISAYGTVLILSKDGWGNGLWSLQDCQNVTLQGGTESQTVITSYQGRVVAMGTDANGKTYADWKPDVGYPVPPDGSTKFPGAIDTVDQNTRYLKVGCGDIYGAPMSALGGGVYRVTLDHNTQQIAVGDWFVGRYLEAPFKIHLSDSRNCILRDIVMMRNGFANIREDGNNGGGNHLLHCTWALGPKPDGATEMPLITNAADGLHSTGANPGPDIENCIFQGVLLDDCLAIHGYFSNVVSSTGNTIIILNRDKGNIRIGEPIRVSDTKNFYVEAMVTAIADDGDGNATVTVDKPVNCPAGAKFSDPLMNGPGCKIIGCEIGGTRSRGILLKGDNGLIEGNTFSNLGMSAVSLGPEFYWGESDYVHNVVVKNNFFNHCGIFGWGGACVLIHGEGAIGNEGIVIANNHFLNDLQTGIEIDWCNGAVISNNRFAGELPRPAGIAQPDAVYVSNSVGITLSDNIVRNASAYNSNLVDIGQNVNGLVNSNGIVSSLQ